MSLSPIRLLGALCVSAFAASAPQMAQIWSLSALKQIDAEMTAAPRNHGLSVKTIGVVGVDPGSIPAAVNQFAPNSLLLVDRTETGESEIHATQNDITTIIEGTATLVTGGKLTKDRKISTNEIRGESITGTDRRAVKAGDIIMVPANMPHQFVLKPGERLVYTVFKAEAH
jgi:mannose-6-phosphate isomerase-like protein (cupin superfamily)